MINFRYHLASLIAVFLALGLGILAGSTFVSSATVGALNRTLQTIDNTNKNLQAQNRTLSEANDAALAWARASRDLMVTGRLAGRPAVLLSFDTTPSGEASQVAATLVQSGALLQGSVVLSSNLALADDASRSAALTVVGGSNSSAAALQAGVAHDLSDSLAGKAPGTVQRLMDVGLARGGPGGGGAQQPPSTLAVPGSAIVILAPGVPPSGSPATADLGRAIVDPLVHGLSAASVLVAVGEDGSSPLPALSTIRQDSTLRVVTVDSVDQPMGQAAIVMGLAEAASSKVFGAYGLGPGASAPLPTPQPSATTQSPSAPASPSRSTG